jgi:surfeit locus 1 family protein
MSYRSRPLLVAGFIVVAVVCARLGVWQVSRLHERRAANALAMKARAAPPIDLTAEVGDSGLAGRRVRARGHYDHAHDVVLRGRAYQGVPGVEIVSPLVLSNDTAAVLVDRGFVPAPDAVTIASDSFREPGPKVVQGLLIPLPSGRGAPIARGDRTTWARLDRDALARRLPYRIYPYTILQLPDSSLPQFPRRLEAPPLDDGPHLSYAIQWFSFSLIALVFAGIMARQRHHPAVQ